MTILCNAGLFLGTQYFYIGVFSRYLVSSTTAYRKMVKKGGKGLKDGFRVLKSEREQKREKDYGT